MNLLGNTVGLHAPNNIIYVYYNFIHCNQILEACWLIALVKLFKSCERILSIEMLHVLDKLQFVPLMC